MANPSAHTLGGGRTEDLNQDPMASLTTALNNMTKEFQTSLSTIVDANKIYSDRMEAVITDQRAQVDQLRSNVVASGVGQTAGATGAVVRRKETDAPLLSEIDPVKWHTFKRCFVRVSTLNEWEEPTAVLKLSTAIRDEAARALAHIKFEDLRSMKEAIGKVEEVILNPAGIEFYKATFKNSHRNPTETLIQWHTRAREMFLRAYPESDEFETDDDLKDKFVLGIKDRTLSTHLKSAEHYDDLTYTQLLTRAQRLHGSALIVQHAYGGRLADAQMNEMKTAPQEEEDNSIQAMNNITCLHCGKPGHMVRECELNQKTIDRVKAEPHKYNLQPLNRSSSRPAQRTFPNFYRNRQPTPFSSNNTFRPRKYSTQRPGFSSRQQRFKRGNRFRSQPPGRRGINQMDNSEQEEEQHYPTSEN